MLKFKVGDKVRVREDLVVGASYEGIVLQPFMASYQGEEFKIIYIDGHVDAIKLLGNPYLWSEQMLEPVTEYPKVMWVSEDGKNWLQRVVFMEKCGKYLAWIDAESLEEAEGVYRMINWKYAKTFEKLTKEMTLEEVCKELGYEVKIVK